MKSITYSFGSNQIFVKDLLAYIFSTGSHIQIKKVTNQFTSQTKYHVFKTEVFNSSFPALYGYSSSFDEDQARNISLAEAAERLAFQSFFVDSGDNFSTEPLRLKGIRLSTGQSCVLDHRRILGFDGRYPSTSSGNAIHYDYNEASFRATVELHERSVLMNFFYTDRRSPTRLNGACLEQKLSTLASSILGFGYKTEFFVYRYLNLPVVCICSIKSTSDDRYPYIFIGTASALALDKAVSSAFSEALRMWVFNYFSIMENKDLPSDRVDQANYYFSPSLGRHLYDFLASGPTQTALDFSEADPKNLYQHYDPISISLLDHKNIKCIRVISDYCCPLFFGQTPPNFPWHGAAPQLPILIHPF